MHSTHLFSAVIILLKGLSSLEAHGAGSRQFGQLSGPLVGGECLDVRRQLSGLLECLGVRRLLSSWVCTPSQADREVYQQKPT